MGKHKKQGELCLSIIHKFFPEVESVTDADESISLEVTKEDEKNASKKDLNGCAMAVAAKRCLKLKGVIISRSKAYLIKYNKAIRCELPASVQKEIVSFDRGGGFAPGEYHLSPPSKTARLGSQYKGGNMRNRNLRPKLKRHMITGVRAVLGGPKAE